MVTQSVQKVDRKHLTSLGLSLGQTLFRAKVSKTIFDSYLFLMFPVIFDCVFLQSYCDDPDLVLELKNLIVIFADTLQVGMDLHPQHTVATKCVTEDLLSSCECAFFVVFSTGLRLPRESSV